MTAQNVLAVDSEDEARICYSNRCLEGFISFEWKRLRNIDDFMSENVGNSHVKIEDNEKVVQILTQDFRLLKLR